MKKLGLIGLVLVLGITLGTTISPLRAQTPSADAQQANCSVGDLSNAACTGKWVYFAGNNHSLDESVWIIRIDSETGETWFKNGKEFQKVRESD